MGKKKVKTEILDESLTNFTEINDDFLQIWKTDLLEREDKKIFLFLGAGAAICDFFTEEQRLPLQKELRPRLLEKVFTNTTIYNQINEYSQTPEFSKLLEQKPNRLEALDIGLFSNITSESKTVEENQERDRIFKILSILPVDMIFQIIFESISKRKLPKI